MIKSARKGTLKPIFGRKLWIQWPPLASCLHNFSVWKGLDFGLICHMMLQRWTIINFHVFSSHLTKIYELKYDFSWVFSVGSSEVVVWQSTSPVSDTPPGATSLLVPCPDSCADLSVAWHAARSHFWQNDHGMPFFTVALDKRWSHTQWHVVHTEEEHICLPPHFLAICDYS